MRCDIWTYSRWLLYFGLLMILIRLISAVFFLRNRVHQNVSLHISFLIFYGSLIGCIILLPQEVVLWLVTQILFPAEVVLCSQSEYQRIREMLSFWWTSLRTSLASYTILLVGGCYVKIRYFGNYVLQKETTSHILWYSIGYIILFPSEVVFL